MSAECLFFCWLAVVYVNKPTLKRRLHICFSKWKVAFSPKIVLSVPHTHFFLCVVLHFYVELIGPLCINIHLFYLIRFQLEFSISCFSWQIDSCHSSHKSENLKRQGLCGLSGDHSPIRQTDTHYLIHLVDSSPLAARLRVPLRAPHLSRAAIHISWSARLEDIVAAVADLCVLCASCKFITPVESA